MKYNYQNGFIQSDDTYIAIINNKPVTTTLQYNIFYRRGTPTKEVNYEVTYTDDIEILMVDSHYNREISDNKVIKKIAMDAKKRCPSADSAFIDYFSEGNYAIIELLSGKTHGVKMQVGEYFYYNSKYVQEVSTHGSIESIIYYGK